MYSFLYVYKCPASLDQAEHQLPSSMSSAAPPVPMVSREWSASDLSRGVKASAAIAGIDVTLLSTDELIQRLQDIVGCFGIVTLQSGIADFGMYTISPSVYLCLCNMLINISVKRHIYIHIEIEKIDR